MNVLVRILGFEEQHLRHDQVGRRVVDGSHEEHDPLLEKARIDVVGPLSAPALLDDHRHEAEGGGVLLGVLQGGKEGHGSSSRLGDPFKMGPNTPDVNSGENF